MLQLYRRFINGILGTWLVHPGPTKNHQKRTTFRFLMKDYYDLERIFEERSNTVNLMDMMISISEDQIVILLYDKAMDLYLYILLHSDHPPEVLTGLVSGNILCIHSLCSDEDKPNHRMEAFYTMLLVRGYHCDFLIPAFTKRITGARVFIKRGSIRRCVSDQEKDTRGPDFFHITYHSRNPTSKDLQHQWLQHLLNPPWERPLWTQKKLKIPIGINSMCVA